VSTLKFGRKQQNVKKYFLVLPVLDDKKGGPCRHIMQQAWPEKII